MPNVCGAEWMDGFVRRFAYPSQKGKNKGNQLLPFSGFAASACIFSVPVAFE